MKLLLLPGFIVLSFTINAQYNLPLNIKLNKHSASYPNTAKKQNVLEKTVKPVYDSIVDFSWDTLGLIWGYNNRVIDIVYNSNKDIVSSNNLNWNGTSWDSNRVINSYDVNYNLINNLNQSYIGGVWENVNQVNYTYDLSNNLLTTIYQNWDGNLWVNNSQYLATYDGNNNNLIWLSQSWSGSAWENSDQYINSYDANNRDTSVLYQIWDGTAWVNDNYETYSYNLNGLVDIWKNYGYSGSDLILIQHDLFTYDANNNLIYELGQWVNGDGTYTNFTQNTYEYDVNNNQIHTYGEAIWNYSQDSTWAPYYDYTFTYNADNIKETAVFFYYFTGTTTGDSIHYYIHSTAGLNEIGAESNLSSVYPNPTSEKFAVHSKNIPDNIEIFTLTGTSVYEKTTISNISEIDASRLEKGIYLVQINSGLRKEVIRITIQ